MPSLESLIASARQAGASDLHLEGGMPPALRVRGELKISGEPVSSQAISDMAFALLGDEGWAAFQLQRSSDLARPMAGIRCRINVMQTARGVGMAIRLLPPFQATLKRLNLHPSLRKLVEARHGLIIVSGPTGSGKSSTLAGLIQEINLSEARHIVTIESPTEHILAPRKSLIRQREVGRHTPSVDQALLDALREDPDVLMVGEMRDPETMRLTLNAAETGHLVLTTTHSSSCAEALQRIVGAFPAEVQGGVSSQLADCLVAVICQRLRFKPEIKMLVPECEILMASSGTRGIIRQGQFFKLGSALDSGGQEGSWSFTRYRDWIESNTEWSLPTERDAEAPVEAAPLEMPVSPVQAPRAPAPPRPATGPRAALAPSPSRAGRSEPDRTPAAPSVASAPAPTPSRSLNGGNPGSKPTDDGVLVIDETNEPLEDLLAQLDRGSRRH